MDPFLKITLLILLVIVVVQDIRHRAIHVVLPVVVFVVGLLRFYLLELNYIELAINMLFLALLMIGLFLYVSFKSRQLVNPINTFIGIGDIIFFVAIIPLFYSTSYILFFSTGMVFSIVTHLLFTKDKERHVPLAGYLSLYLGGLLIIDFFMSQELFYSHYSL